MGRARQLLAKAILKPLVIWAHRLGRLLAPAAATIGRACVNAKAKYDANPKGNHTHPVRRRLRGLVHRTGSP